MNIYIYNLQMIIYIQFNIITINNLVFSDLESNID